MPSKLEDYEVINTIGSGSYGTCKKIRRKSDGKVLVWKELNYGDMTEDEKQMLVSEVNVLRELKHEHIVRYYDRIIDRRNTILYLVMEYCEGGDLSTLISRCRRDRKYLEEDFVWRVFFQLSLALKECHKRRSRGSILHRDLKPANVFLDDKHNVKLGDFGLARVLAHSNSFARTFVGTPYYMSPEQISELAYNEKSDIWSLGCLLYELCTLVPPFNAVNQKALAVKIRDGQFRRLPSHFSNELSHCITNMLQVQREKRPSIEDLLKTASLSSRLFSLEHSKEQELLQRKKEQLTEWETALKQREELLNIREAALVEREQLLKLTEERLQRPAELAKPKPAFEIYVKAATDSRASPTVLKEVNIPKMKENDTNQANKKKVTFCVGPTKHSRLSENQVLPVANQDQASVKSLAPLNVPVVAPIRERKGLRC